MSEESFDFLLAQEILDVIPRIMRRIRAEMRATAKPQLTIAQLRIMGRLNREKSATISDLAEGQGVSVPAMSKMVGVMESRNALERLPSSSDRRQVSVALTEEGKTLFLSIRKVVRVKIAEQLRNASAEKKQRLLTSIQALSEFFP